jgi:hypothetical protein
MAKKFAGFTDDQAMVLLNKVGFTGQSMQSDEVNAFLASNPSAQAKLGKYADAAQKRLDMLTKPTTGYAVGGLQTSGSMLGSFFGAGTGVDALPLGLAAQSKDPTPGGPLVPMPTMPDWVTPPPTGTPVTTAFQTLTNPATGETYQAPSGGYSVNTSAIAKPQGVFQDPNAMATALTTPSTILTPVTPNITTGITGAREGLATQQNELNRLQQAFAAINPLDTAAQNAAMASINSQQAKVAQAQAVLGSQQSQYQTINRPSIGEATTTALSSPTSMTQQAPVSQITGAPDQKIDVATGQITGTTPAAYTAVASMDNAAVAPTAPALATVTPTAASPAVQGTLDKLQAATGLVGPDALIQAATMTPDQLAALGLTVEQINQARTVIAPPARTAQAGEMISGSTVDMAAVDKAVNFEAATGAPSSAGTVQGQLTSLMQQFEGDATPAWAAGAMRAATATLASRGLGASSMAGQAIIQATMESALPIAMQDAQTTAGFEIQNLSNRQATAMFGAQQRATFLGMDFDQKFQTKVANASRIADIANMNFSADQQIALENARMAQTVDLTNLSAKNGKIMADAATLSQMDMTNLNNRQQAAVVNAQSFLQMDMQNLNNEQQTSVFKAQSVVNSLLSDTAAENAAKQFNATSENQTNQFFANIASTVAQFNVDQKNAMQRFNAGEVNTIAQFNSTLQNQREQFNASNSLIIEQANAQWMQTITTTNNAAINASNRDAAIAANSLTSTAYNNLLQQERDIMNYAFQTANSNAERNTALALANISADATITSAELQLQGDQATASGQKSSGLASAAGSVLGAMLSGWNPFTR